MQVSALIYLGGLGVGKWGRGVRDEARVSGKGFPCQAVTFGLIPVDNWQPLKVI